MKNQLEFSFDDEVASKFCYDSDNQSITVHFTGYSNLLTNERATDSKCVLTIKAWESAKGMIHGETDYISLEKCISIFSIILSIELLGQWLTMEVNTLNNKYIRLVFCNAQIIFTHE